MIRLLPVLLLLLVFVAGCETGRLDEPDRPDTAARPDTAVLRPDTAVLRAEPRRAEIRVGRQPLDLRFPTSNDALFTDASAFYASLDLHTIPGLRKAGWEGGQYGFVRSPVRTPGGNVLGQLHEGLDIRPLYRDPAGEPLDTVVTVADGRVTYVNRAAGGSSYGRYVVVRHQWDESPVYTLYAHLSTLAVRAGDSVRTGEPLGRLGWTGRGTALHRAHVHFEVGLLLNEHFQRWFDAYYRSRNAHGLYFGKNIAGVNPAALYRALRYDPTLSFSEFVRGQHVAYQLAIPGTYPLNILERYPWIADRGVTPADTAASGAWLVSFTREGVPIRVGRREEPAAEPEVVYVAPDIRRGYLSTAGNLARTDTTYSLTREGRALAALLATSERGVPPWF